MNRFRMLLLGLIFLGAFSLSGASKAPAPSGAVGIPKNELAKALDVVRAWNLVNKAVYEKVSPAVVVINSTRFDAENPEEGADPFDFFHRPQKKNAPPPRDPQESQGSGFVVQSNGYIFTNNHVVQGASKIQVKLKDGRMFDARVIGVDEKTDMAVLKIEAKNLPTVEFGDSDVIQPGEWTIALGAPYNLDYSFTCGPLSGKLRTLGAMMYEEYLQTQAPINPGNSGGPLVDMEGRVIGINTLIKTRPGSGFNPQNALIGFAIPIKLAQKIGNTLITKGKVERPWIGVDIQTLADATEVKSIIKGIAQGVVIMAIHPETPAIASGLEPLDVITAIDGLPVQNSRDLQRLVLEKQIGQVIKLTVYRDGRELAMDLKTGLQPTTEQFASMNQPKPAPLGVGSQSYGMTLQPLPADIAKEAGIEVKDGVLVVDVDDGSPAARAGLVPGTIITKVDGKKVSRPQNVKDALVHGNPRVGAKVQIIREGIRTFVILKLSGEAEATPPPQQEY